MKNLAHEETYRGCKIELHYDPDSDSPRTWDNVGTMVCWHRRYTLGDEQPKESAGDWFLNFVQGGRRWDEEKVKREQAIRDRNAAALEHIEDDEERPNLCDEMDRELDEVESKMEDDTKLHRALFDRDNLRLPLYLYDHSGITICTSPFSCPWDSGQVGFIYVSLEKAAKEASLRGKPTWDSPCEWGGTWVDGKRIGGETITLRQWALKTLKGEVQTYDDYLQGDVVGYVAEDPDGEEIDSCWGYYPEHEEGKEDYAYCLSEARAAIDHWHEEKVKTETATTACFI